MKNFTSRMFVNTERSFMLPFDYDGDMFCPAHVQVIKELIKNNDEETAQALAEGFGFTLLKGQGTDCPAGDVDVIVVYSRFISERDVSMFWWLEDTRDTTGPILTSFEEKYSDGITITKACPLCNRPTRYCNCGISDSNWPN